MVYKIYRNEINESTQKEMWQAPYIPLLRSSIDKIQLQLYTSGPSGAKPHEAHLNEVEELAKEISSDNAPTPGYLLKPFGVKVDDSIPECCYQWDWPQSVVTSIFKGHHRASA